MRIDGISSEIEIVRSRRKTMSAEIEPDGKVIVRAPLKLPMRDIESFLNEKSRLIEKHVRKHIAENDALSETRPFTPAEIRKMADMAAEIIPRRVEYYAELMGISYNRITIRNQKTRWGSCTSEGNLNFNCLLVMTPPEVLDSVVVHELCHRIHPNHSKAFYDAVYKVFPDYDRCDKWLKENGRLLIRRMTGE
ncbi:MAG: M48 family metallopeptidase [Ruminiclostridium sp.]|nr:M48 family metallopeptidase [Ruminiclostridium sp.]